MRGLTVTLASSLSIFYEITSYFPSDPLDLCVFSLFNCSLSCYLSNFHYSKPPHWSHGLWFLMANLINKSQGKEDIECLLLIQSLLCSTAEPHSVGFLLTLICLIFLLLFTSLDILDLLCFGFPIPMPACSDSDFVFLLVICPCSPHFLNHLLLLLLLCLFGTILWTCAAFAWFPADKNGPFLSLEEMTLEKQPALVHPSSTQSCLPWGSSKQDLKHVKAYSPEIQSCGPAICLVASC